MLIAEYKYLKVTFCCLLLLLATGLAAAAIGDAQPVVASQDAVDLASDENDAESPPSRADRPRRRPRQDDSERRKRPDQRQQWQRPEPTESTGLVPLTELGEETYKGYTGGLYGQGNNAPPAKHQRAAQQQLARIRPLDKNGKPLSNGKIVFISLGMSNTTQEFSVFKKMADNDPNVNPTVQIVDCAVGGMAAHQWAYPDRVTRRNRPSPWTVMDNRLKKAEVSDQQVQVVWIKQAQMAPARLGEFPEHAKELQKDTATILTMLKEKFPNLRIAYLSNRIYAGYATTPLNPEPYAYESAFSVRWLIEDQIKSDSALNYDPEKGKVTSPLLLWGPYLWADGVKGRKSDDLTWQKEDFAGDGTHPSNSGREKVAQLLLDFFKNNPNAKGWFLKN